MKRGGRRPEARIVDLDTHPTPVVCLRVAAEYLRISERALLKRIDDGRLRAWRDDKVIRIELLDLKAYLRQGECSP